MPIINGEASPDAQDFVVVLALEGKKQPWCTGTMIAKNLVLTARHCVGDLNADETIVFDFAASELSVYRGREAGPRTINQPPDAKGVKLFNSGSPSLSVDVAVLQIDKELDIPVAPLRVDKNVAKGESVDVIGYGVTEDNQFPSSRQWRKGLAVTQTGPGKSAFFELVAGEFLFGEASCVGDSGGPALIGNSVVGVATRVSNGETPSDFRPSNFCLGDKTETVYTDLVLAKPFIDKALQAVGAAPTTPAPAAPAEEDSGCHVAPGAGPGHAPVEAAFMLAALLIWRTAGLAYRRADNLRRDTRPLRSRSSQTAKPHRAS